MASLTRVEAAARAALINVDVVRRRPRPRPRGRALRVRDDDPVHAAPSPAPRPSSTSGRETLHAVTLNGRPLDPASAVRRAARAGRPGGRQRARGRGDDGLQPRRPGAAPQRRPRRRRALRLRPPLPRRRAERCSRCFDQPDLKAPYDVAVTAPVEWTVLGNGAATGAAPGRTSWRRRRPLATYFVTVCAGPYASVRAEHDGIPLGVHARRSLEHAPARAGRAHARDDPGMLRLLPPAVRHPVPVRGVPPGVRAGVQRRGDGEPGLRDVPRHDALPRRGDPGPGALRAATPSRTRWPTCGSATS